MRSRKPASHKDRAWSEWDIRNGDGEVVHLLAMTRISWELLGKPLSSFPQCTDHVMIFSEEPNRIYSTEQQIWVKSILIKS